MITTATAATVLPLLRKLRIEKRQDALTESERHTVYDVLEPAGLVVRVLKMRGRTIWVQLTPEGKALLRKAHEAALAVVAQEL